MTEPIRAFIALELPTSLKDYLYQLGQQLGGQLPARSVKWVKPQNMHLTLVFLGDGVTAEQVTEISGRIDQIAAAFAPFNFHLSKLGAFPNPKAPRVIWVGIDGDVKPLQTLKSQLDQALEPLGWKPEKRRYSPHLTLGRVKDSHAIGRAFLPFGKPVQTREFTTTAVHLYSSTLTPQGPQYDIVHTSNFNQ